MNQKLQQALATARAFLTDSSDGSTGGYNPFAGDEARAALSTIEEALQAWEKHQEICSGDVENDTPTELDRSNPFARQWKENPVPVEPAARFIHGVRYYAGMLEDGDGWWHSLGHIESLCKEFQGAIDARAGKQAEPPAPPVECSCSCHPMLGVGLRMLCCRTEPHTGKPVEAPPAERAIVVGSTWRIPIEQLVLRVSPGGRHVQLADGRWVFADYLHRHGEWVRDFSAEEQPASGRVSDPAPPSPPEPTPDSPPFAPKELAEFAGRGFERVNRGAIEVEPVARAERGKR